MRTWPGSMLCARVNSRQRVVVEVGALPAGSARRNSCSVILAHSSGALDEGRYAVTFNRLPVLGAVATRVPEACPTGSPAAICGGLGEELPNRYVFCAAILLSDPLVCSTIPPGPSGRGNPRPQRARAQIPVSVYSTPGLCVPSAPPPLLGTCPLKRYSFRRARSRARSPSAASRSLRSASGDAQRPVPAISFSSAGPGGAWRRAWVRHGRIGPAQA